MKICKFRLRFQLSLFARVQLTIFHHGSHHQFRIWFVAWPATSYFLNQWWPRLTTRICVTRPQWVNNTNVIILCLHGTCTSHVFHRIFLSYTPIALTAHKHYDDWYQRSLDAWMGKLCNNNGRNEIFSIKLDGIRSLCFFKYDILVWMKLVANTKNRFNDKKHVYAFTA